MRKLKKVININNRKENKCKDHKHKPSNQILYKGNNYNYT